MRNFQSTFVTQVTKYRSTNLDPFYMQTEQAILSSMHCQLCCQQQKKDIITTYCLLDEFSLILCSEGNK